MIVKRDNSKDRFRAGRRIAEKLAKKFLSGQLAFPWFDRHEDEPTHQDPAAAGDETDAPPRPTGRAIG